MDFLAEMPHMEKCTQIWSAKKFQMSSHGRREVRNRQKGFCAFSSDAADHTSMNKKAHIPPERLYKNTKANL